MIIRAVAVLVFFLALSGFNDIKLKKTKVTDNITVSLPENFYVMSPTDIARRYPSVRKPLAAYTNDQRLVDFSINKSATMWRDQDVEMAKDFVKSSIDNMFDQVNFLQEDIREINGRTFIVMEFESRMEGDNNNLTQNAGIAKYSYMQYLISQGQMIVFSFHAPAKLQNIWQPVAPEIMSSIKISNKL